MQRTFTFNKPIVILYMLPLVALLVFLIFGLLREMNFFVLLMVLISIALMVPVFWLSFLRRLSITPEKAVWKTPSKQFEIPMVEVRHYGIVKFRSFRFIYVSKSETPPFESPESKVISNEDTFVIQFRRGAYYFLENQIHKVHPEIEPVAYRKD